MKKACGIVMSLLALASVAAAQPAPEWTHLSEEDGFTLSTGAPSEKDGVTAMDLLFVYDQPRPHLDHWFYRSVRQHFEFECARRTYRVTGLEMFEDGAGGGAAIARRIFKDAFVEPTADSRASRLVKIACAR